MTDFLRPKITLRGPELMGACHEPPDHKSRRDATQAGWMIPKEKPTKRRKQFTDRSQLSPVFVGRSLLVPDSLRMLKWHSNIRRDSMRYHSLRFEGLDAWTHGHVCVVVTDEEDPPEANVRCSHLTPDIDATVSSAIMPRSTTMGYQSPGWNQWLLQDFGGNVSNWNSH